MRPRRCSTLAVLMAVTAALVVADGILCWLYYRHAADRVAHHAIFEGYSADVGIVFFSDFSGNGGPDDETVRRLGHASDLFRKGTIAHVLCVGGGRPGRPQAGAHLMRDRVQDMGIPRERTLAAPHSYDTRSNVREAFDLAGIMGWKRVLLICTPLHCHRIRTAVAEHGGTEQVSFAPIDEAQTGAASLWVQLHTEITAAALGAVLPAPVYDRMIRAMRYRALQELWR